MNKVIRMVTIFHQEFDQPIAETPHLPEDRDRRALRMKLLEDAYHEYRYAEREENLVKIARALANMVYVVGGTSVEYGIPISQLLDEVHRSRMTCDTCLEDGKMEKGTRYEKPRIAEIICEAMYGDARRIDRFLRNKDD